MKVELITYTQNADEVCAISAQTCVSHHIPKGGVVALGSLKHALQSGHESVAEHAVFTFSISGVSRILETQLVRHRIGCSYSIQSGRYCARDPTNYMIPFEPQGALRDAVDNFNTALKNLDDMLISSNVKEEDRRYFYPQGLKTNIIVTVNARELRHIAGERMCALAQTEIRELVTEMVRQAKEVAPILMDGVGAKCERTHVCYERNGCGKYPKKS